MKDFSDERYSFLLLDGNENVGFAYVEWRDSAWWLADIWVDDFVRCQGHGSALLSEACEWADVTDVTLHLNVEGDPAGDLCDDDLYEWYERYGFIRCADGTMVRPTWTSRLP